ncbi:hypothetical protein FACS189444_4070 [Spirochaetia bacterium]|nr:hypothetical protein FACS189444_4070 [Spirochaetia bacterium]
MEFLAINLEDFHNQQDSVVVWTRVRFIHSPTRKMAEDFMRCEFPDFPCVLITKEHFDKNIVRSKA